MAPALTESRIDEPSGFTYDRPSKLIFPDGIKTSGQTDPNHDQIKPYAEFTKEITGPTVWKAEDYAYNPERWTHYLSEEEVNELSIAADAFIDSATPLTGICKVSYSRSYFRGISPITSHLTIF